MAVKLRLTRIGKKKQPQYRIVAADARSPRDSLAGGQPATHTARRAAPHPHERALARSASKIDPRGRAGSRAEPIRWGINWRCPI